MLLRRCALFALLAGIFLICGCESSNKGKIEATKWKSLATTVKGQQIPEGAVEILFGGNGKLMYTFTPPGSSKQVYNGSYSLGIGDYVTLELDQELAGRKTHSEKVVINGKHLTMTDTDGTTITFKKIE